MQHRKLDKSAMFMGVVLPICRIICKNRVGERLRFAAQLNALVLFGHRF